MIILGLDPAIRTSGYGVIEVNEQTREMKVLDCGVIINKNSMPHSECLRRIAGGVAELIATYQIDAAAIEEPLSVEIARLQLFWEWQEEHLWRNLQKIISPFILIVPNLLKNRQ